MTPVRLAPVLLARLWTDQTCTGKLIPASPNAPRTGLLSWVIPLRSSGFWRPMQLRNRTAPAQVTRLSGSAPGACVADRSPLDQAPSLHPLRGRSLDVVRGLPRYYAPVRLLRLVHHRLRPLRPSRRGPGGTRPSRSSRRPPRFRRHPFLRDVVFDHGRATAPRISVPHVLPSTLLTASASATFALSRLNSTPHRIAVYASQPPSPTTTQHSLPGARYGLPVPVFHRLDRASFPGAQAISCRISPAQAARDCFVAALLAMTIAPSCA